MSEVKHLQEKHSRELSGLRQAKAAEIQLLTNRLMERTEASCALSSELKENKRQAEMRESKLRSQMTEEKAKVEKMAHQEKVIYKFLMHLSLPIYSLVPLSLSQLLMLEREAIYTSTSVFKVCAHLCICSGHRRTGLHLSKL